MCIIGKYKLHTKQKKFINWVIIKTKIYPGIKAKLRNIIDTDGYLEEDRQLLNVLRIQHLRQYKIEI